MGDDMDEAIGEWRNRNKEANLYLSDEYSYKKYLEWCRQLSHKSEGVKNVHTVYSRVTGNDSEI